jgi:ABC-type sugar transport system substrate-binding protein
VPLKRALRSIRLVTLLSLAGLVVAAAMAGVVASAPGSAGKGSGEIYKAKPALLEKAFGTTTGIPKSVLAAVYRAGLPITSARLKLALKCWKQNVCDTGTKGKFTVALADGFGENVWREVTHMEFVLGALTYPEIGKIIYVSGQNNTQKQISDFRSLIAQKVNMIIGFPDAGPAMLPSYRGEGLYVVRLRGSMPAGEELRRRLEQPGEERRGRLPRGNAGQRPVQGVADV